MEFHDVACSQCGFVYALLHPDQNFLNDYYAAQHTVFDSDVVVGDHYDAETRLMLLQSLVPQKARILEVGAANGQFCARLVQAGYAAEGWDPVVHTGSELVKNRFVDSTAEGNQRFDAVISYYVMEHIANLSAWVGSLAAQLRDGGLFLAEVPDFSRHPFESLNHEHLLHFRREHMVAFLEAHGFEILDTHLHAASRYFGFVVAGRLVDRERSINPVFVDLGGEGQRLLSEAQAGYARAQKTADAHDRFAGEVAERVERAAASVPEAAVCFWAANEHASRIASHLAEKELRPVVVDNARSKIGTFHLGFSTPVARPIPEQLRNRHIIFVLCSPSWNSEIRKQISAMDLRSYEIIPGVVEEN